MNRKCVIAFVLVCSVFCSYAQSNQLLRRQGSEAAMNKDWFAAEQYFGRLYLRDSSNVPVLNDYAIAAREALDLDVAIRLHKRLATLDNGDKYPLTFFYLGQLYKYKADYKEAKRWYQKFSRIDQINKDKFAYYRKKCKVEMESCDLAPEIMAQPLKIEMLHMEPQVNTKGAEFAAVEVDSVLYFTAARPEKKDAESNEMVTNAKAYRTDLRRGRPIRARVFDTLVNAPAYQVANPVPSPDNKLLFFTRCTKEAGGYNRCELYCVRQISGRWIMTQRLPDPLNAKGFSTTQPAFGKVRGQWVLFFASDRPGGQGGLDIWYAPWRGDTLFDAPLHTGISVNTPDDEVSPWYDARKDHLVFSSTWHKGLGGFDVFYSKIREGNFMPPDNAGYPINSSFNDVYYSISNLGHHVYLSSNRKGTLFEGNRVNCCSDVFVFNADTTRPLPPPPPPKVDSVVVKKNEMKLLVPLTLYFHNDEPDPRTTKTTSKRNYADVFRDYERLRKTYVKEFTTGLEGEDKEAAENKIREFFSDSVKAGLENLDRFTALMKEVLLKGETVKITLKGYCSPLASTDYNVNLAKRRISSLRNYFMEKDNGWFMKYINNTTPGEGRIEIQEVEVGELVKTRASDNLADKRNSVYSPEAAAERKIQIIAVSFNE